MSETVNQSELKQIMRYYFQTTGRLLFWQRNEAMQTLEGQIIDLLLAVLEKPQYKDACRKVLDDVASVQTVSDCSVLKLSDSLLEDRVMSFYDMKCDTLRHYKIEEDLFFDMDILLMDKRQWVIDGDPGALALGAWLGYLELDPEYGKQAAMRYWKVLAYTGDRLSMRALIYAYKEMGDEKMADYWQQVWSICLEADRQLTITVPGEFLDKCSKEALETAQVILAVRRRCADDEKEPLPIPLIQYAMDSHDSVEEKLGNLNASPYAYYAMLADQTEREHKTVGFAI